MKRLILSILFLSLINNINSQNILFQDVFYGGVTCAGISQGRGFDQEIRFINVHIEPNSTIRKAFLIFNRNSHALPTMIKFNGFNHILDSTNKIQDYFIFSGSTIDSCAINIIDVTNDVSPNINTYVLNLQAQNNIGFYGCFYLYIAYENPILSKIATTLYYNTQNLGLSNSYNFNGYLPIDTSKDVGLAIQSDIIWDTITDGSFVKLNNFNLGLIGGTDLCDSMRIGAGVKGHFYYQDGILHGLDDDTPDNTMKGTDGLANIRNMLYGSLSSINLYFKRQFTYTPYNAYISFPLTYTTPCAIIPAVISSDTTICQGETVQLHASGGTKYEWKCLTDTLPYGNSVYGLSCKNCANPVFSGDSSAVYTVRVWNGDSCSVVRPVRVTVNSRPKGVFSTIQTACGEQKGVIKTQSNPALQTFYAIAENGDTLQSSYQNIPQVGAGNYMTFFIDTNGCQSNDSLVTVKSFSNVTADFTITPTSGGAPLGIHITNTSQNAQNYQWSINGQNVSNPPTHFDTSGTYIVQLVAWDQHPECADTMTKTVLVFDSLIVQIPNVFSPNNDGVNDVFAIQTNLPVRVKAVILNRWGNEVFTCDKNLTVGNNDVWSGETKTHETVVDGTYFYRITFQLDEKMVDCNLQPCEVKKEGFVQVVK